MSQVSPNNKTRQAIATAVPSLSLNPHVMFEEAREKQGGKFCGCCCDYRRAVIIVVLVLVVCEILVLIAVLAGEYSRVYCGDYYECDEFMNKYETMEIIFSVVSIILGIAAIVGARIFNTFLVGANAFWLIAGIILNAVISMQMCKEWQDQGAEYTCQTPYGLFVIAVIIVLLFVYPHVGFIVEVKKGIMSHETYPREEYSCCCV